MQIVDFFIPNVMKVVTVTSDKANVNQISGQAVLEMRVAISDWVKAKTKNGELIHGFVETVDAEQKLVTLFVVQSDNDESIGKSVVVREQWLRKLPTYTLADAEPIKGLIDIALSTRDEEWFNELTQALTSLSQNAGADLLKRSINSRSSNRLGYPV